MRDQKLSSVIFMTALRMNGAAKTTTGSIMSHDISQDEIQFRKKLPSSKKAKLATAAAIQEVRPDWITPKIKWPYRCGILGIGISNFDARRDQLCDEREWSRSFGYFGVMLSLLKAKPCTMLATKNGIRAHNRRPIKLIGSQERLSGALKGKWSMR